MTMLFVQEFKKRHKCSSCAKAPLANYSLCGTHLVAARERFRVWSVERRAAGRCVRCNRKSFKAFLRCRLHTKENRERCARWMAAHPEYNKQQWARLKALRDAGFCPSCPEHRRLEVPFKRCEPCRKRQRSSARVEVVS